MADELRELATAALEDGLIDEGETGAWAIRHFSTICKALSAVAHPVPPQNQPSWHPWGDFLRVRCDVIDWLYQEMGRSDEKIAHVLSMDPEQVMLIRTRDRSLAAAPSTAS